MAGGARYPLLGADDVAYLHGTVVDDVSQVVGGVAVRLEQDEVVEGIILEDDIAVYQILKAGLPLQGYLKAHHGHDALSLFFSTLLGGQIAAVAVIAGGLLALNLLGAHGLKALRGAVAVVGAPLLNELLGGVFIELQALRLVVRPIVAADIGAFVPVQLQPAQGIKDVLLRPLHLAGDVGVLDADDELAAVATGEEPVKQSRADIAHVGIAGGAGGKADSNGFFHCLTFYHPIGEDSRVGGEKFIEVTPQHGKVGIGWEEKR